MAAITAAAVKALRETTGLPMMDCKRALQEADGDQEKAVDILRKAGAKTMEKRAGRQTAAGRIAIFADFGATPGSSIVELKCESTPVANNDEFLQLANDLAQQLATGPGASTPEELLAQPSPSKQGQTLQQQLDDLTNRIREVFRLERVARIDGICGGYAHHNGASAVLIEVEGGNAELAKDICMHVAAMRPQALNRDALDPTVVEKEREILSEQARAEGKPDNIIEKMVEGRMRNYYADHCLIDQAFVKAEDGKTSVGQTAKDAGMTLKSFIHWELTKE